MTTTTCIVGLVKDGVVYIGSDSAAVGGYDIHAIKFNKSFIIGSGANSMLIGYTTSFRMGQVLEYEVTPPEYPEGMDVMRYMVSRFIPHLIVTFGQKWKDRLAGNEFKGGNFLAGFRGRLFSIQSDFQVNEAANDYLADGCGQSYALGSLYSTAGQALTPEQRILKALEAAAHHSAGVCAPFHVMKLETAASVPHAEPIPATQEVPDHPTVQIRAKRSGKR